MACTKLCRQFNAGCSVPSITAANTRFGFTQHGLNLAVRHLSVVGMNDPLVDELNDLVIS